MAIATAVAASKLQSTAHSGRRRLLVVVTGAGAAALIWTAAVPLLGVQLLVRFGSGAPQTVGLGFVLAGSLMAPLLGWALLAVFERHTHRAGALWTRIAVAALLASFALPLVAGASTSSKISLLLMHIAVGSVVITGLRRN